MHNENITLYKVGLLLPMMHSHNMAVAMLVRTESLLTLNRNCYACTVILNIVTLIL